ncbi:MAG: hypothetical protein EKK42_20265 [Pseudonocardiaceae bacterium]|nr:MAG: hypothetical protein EKK42_20265 [Pseudonocardiaceae bacterium]
MTSTYAVGSIIGADDLDTLPTGTKLEFTAGGMRVTELPPQQSERDQLMCDLFNAMFSPRTPKTHVDQFLSTITRDEFQNIADYVLDNFTRNGAHSPDTVTDVDGDMWTRAEDGTYVLGTFVQSGGGRTLDSIRENFGPLRDDPAPKLEVLIDRDGDRWEQLPDGEFIMRTQSGHLLSSSPWTREQLEREYSPLRAA